ncbi:MAG: hypothetical protein ACFB0C_19635 [Leptolyngbyaceae cyanobacterium]
MPEVLIHVDGGTFALRADRLRLSDRTQIRSFGSGVADESSEIVAVPDRLSLERVFRPGSLELQEAIVRAAEQGRRFRVRLPIRWYDHKFFDVQIVEFSGLSSSGLFCFKEIAFQVVALQTAMT